MLGEGTLPVSGCRNVEGPPVTGEVRALHYRRHPAVAEALQVTRESDMAAPAYSHPTRRNVACTNGFQCSESVSTWISDGRVMLAAPSAGATLMTSEAARRLADNLRDHADAIDAERRVFDRRDVSLIRR